MPSSPKSKNIPYRKPVQLQSPNWLHKPVGDGTFYRHHQQTREKEAKITMASINPPAYRRWVVGKPWARLTPKVAVIKRWSEFGTIKQMSHSSCGIYRIPVLTVGSAQHIQAQHGFCVVSASPLLLTHKEQAEVRPSCPVSMQCYSTCYGSSTFDLWVTYTYLHYNIIWSTCNLLR